MYLMTYIDPVTGKVVYTLKKTGPDAKPTQSAHPARFSPDDKFSRVRSRQRMRPSPRAAARLAL